MALAKKRRLAKNPRPATARTKADPDYMLSLARGLAVIRAFGRGAEKVSTAEVARQIGVSRAAARRCLHTLTVLGYVAGAEGQYRLTPRVLALAHAYLGSDAVPRAAQPVLEGVADRLHESCSLSVLDGDEIVYVARASTRRILTIGLSVGSRLPVYCTSMGRVLLAFASDAERRVYLSRVRPVRHTPRTIADREDLRAEIERVRAQGYAIVDQELEIGLRSLAVPVRRQDQSVVAAINVGVQATRVERDTMVREYLPVLRAAAEKIGFAIGHLR
jgi:IclR family pca regulon transcriptional regulator